MLIMQIWWPIATQPAVKHGSGQKKLFFHLLDLVVVNSYIPLSSCGGKKISHRDFQLTLIRVMMAWSGHEPRPSMPVGRPASSSYNTERLDTHHNKHWPGHNPKQAALSRVFSKGRDTNCAIHMCQVWRGALCGPKLFWRLPHKKSLIRHLFFRSLCKLLEPRPQCK